MGDDIDWGRLINSMIAQESNYDPRATSPVGAQGYMQLMPKTRQDPGFGVKPYSADDPYDPDENVRFGTDYIKALHGYLTKKGFTGEDAIRRALVGYNYGIGHAEKWDGDDMSLPQEPREYHRRIYDNRYKNPEWQPNEDVAPLIMASLGIVPEEADKKKPPVIEEIVLESSPPLQRESSQEKQEWPTPQHGLMSRLREFLRRLSARK